MTAGLFHRYYAALVLDEEEEYAEVIRSLSDHIVDNPANGAAFNNRAVAYQEIGQLELAMGDFDEAVRLSPSSPIPAIGRANLRTQAGDSAGAMADLDLAFLIGPADAYLCRTRAQSRLETGDLHGALSDFSRAIAKQPLFARHYHDRASVRERLGHVIRARSDRLVAFVLERLA